VVVDGRAIGPGSPCFVIAEVGVNHDGDEARAVELIGAAADAGADAVKFQLFSAEKLATPGAPKAAYQVETTGLAESQLEMLRKLELSLESHRRLRDHCRSLGLMYLATPFDLVSIDVLVGLEVPALKIGSGDVTNTPLLAHAATTGLPIVLSTGMSYLHEIEAALDTLREAGAGDIVLLHCVSAYPAEAEDVNLRAMATLRETFGVPVGFSDHTLGTSVALAAVALGACVLEKHLTLNPSLPGPDHRSSLDPRAFARLVGELRDVEAALGNGTKAPAPGEEPNRQIARRSLAAAQSIPAGTVLTREMLMTLRPAAGIEPTKIAAMVGQKTTRTLAAGELLGPNDVA